ncbi:major outer membrane protein [Campylobacter showae]|uniref:major outer membrane protein n=2 Tax=Campylobacter showae TaxID=204 RepID=UPI000F0889D7|nr:major outer membrane protein [Campylobacter showae]
MKIAKISLVALVALGAFSTVASATPLEEAIKNVDLSGYARYRYNNIAVKDSAGQKDNTVAHHQFKSEFSFKAALDDNFFGVLTLRYNSSDSSAFGADNRADNTNTTSPFNVKEFYLGYKTGNTTITAGKQEIGSFFTDDAVGTGLRVENQDIAGLTLTALAFDALENNSESDGNIYGFLPRIFNNNLYAVAAIGSYDPVSFQLWYASLVDSVNLMIGDVNFSLNVTDDVNIGAQVQYAHADIDSNVGTDYKDTDFYATELGTKVFGADVAAGYIGYKVHDKAKGFVSLEDQGSFIDVGEIKSALDYTALEGKANFWFLKAGYTFAEKFRVGGDYSNGKVKLASGDKEKYQEYVARLTYDYSAKLQFSSFYAYEINKHQDDSKDKTKQLRFQAKYTF